jgi:hypothetical protein
MTCSALLICSQLSAADNIISNACLQLMIPEQRLQRSPGATRVGCGGCSCLRSTTSCCTYYTEWFAANGLQRLVCSQ